LPGKTHGPRASRRHLSEGKSGSPLAEGKRVRSAGVNCERLIIQRTTGRGKQKANLVACWFVAVHKCSVSFKDGRGVVHSTDVLAETVMEAAALGLRSFREQGMLDDDGVFDVQVEVTTMTVHSVPITKLRAWLDSSSSDLKTQAVKARVR
jgi:hypothetical protein